MRWLHQSWFLKKSFRGKQLTVLSPWLHPVCDVAHPCLFFVYKIQVNESLTGLFIGLLMAQFCLLFSNCAASEPLTIFKTFYSYFSLNCNSRFMKEWALGGPDFTFGMSCRVGYCYLVRGLWPWAVQDAKKSVRGISILDSGPISLFQIRPQNKQRCK